MMKIALFGSNDLQFGKVYTEAVLEHLASYGELSERISKKNIDTYRDFLSDCEIAFATWGMPQFSEEEIREYMPKLKMLFYSAGTVQYFAKPFLSCGVRVFSAFAANAVPVTEYTAAQITLASKGFFQAAKHYRSCTPRALMHVQNSPGNFGNKIGIIGLGAIGSEVAKRLSGLDAELFAYDPFVSEERARELNVKLTDLETIFSECDVISNHLANKKELNNIFNYRLFKLMKKNSVFINTGRGAQVSEWGLTLALIAHPSRTAVLDVIKREFFPYINPLFWCPGAVLTPHMAGSSGREPQRMAYYMTEQLENYLAGRDMKYEVTAEMLEHMA